MLSMSRVQDIFEDMQASRPRTWKSVLKAKHVLEDSTSVKFSSNNKVNND